MAKHLNSVSFQLEPWVKAFLLLISLALLVPSPATAELTAPQWTRVTPEGGKIIRFHFFWSKTCPHCRQAKPFIDGLVQSYDWLELNSYEISESQENAALFRTLSEKFGEEKFAVPAFLFCEQVVIGYLNDQTSGTLLRDQLLQCRKALVQGIEAPSKTLEADEPKLSIPFLGEFDSQSLSLPVFTLIIAGLDAFNPCAFFVLLLLLSLLVNAKDRKRMLLIGGIFVFFSGFIYFIFMAAWLNLFLYLRELRLITVIAAIAAIGVSLINIKDYFSFKRGISLSIPDSAKPGLYGQIRKLMDTSSLPTMITGTIMLAIVANAYELLCTSGFPMIFTRILTLNNLPTLDYYLYLALYNIIYVVPLIAIVLLFIKTLGARKLSEKEGRILKLISGMMMLELGLLLLFAPDLLSQLYIAICLIAVAIIISGFILYLDKKMNLTEHH
ncbi:MAG: thioredoxin family protein [Nitrospina sp.]|nr:thioredoxin family protein [Nitrospina sp.]